MILFQEAFLFFCLRNSRFTDSFNEFSRIMNLESTNFGSYLILFQKARSQEAMDVNLFGHVRNKLPLFNAA